MHVANPIICWNICHPLALNVVVRHNSGPLCCAFPQKKSFGKKHDDKSDGLFSVVPQGAWVTQWPSLLSVDTHTSLMEGVLYLWSYLIFHLFLLPDLLPLFCPSCAWSPRQTLCHWLFLTYLSQFFYCCVGHHSTLWQYWYSYVDMEWPWEVPITQGHTVSILRLILVDYPLPYAIGKANQFSFNLDSFR